jgi:hypothetical protein
MYSCSLSDCVHFPPVIPASSITIPSRGQWGGVAICPSPQRNLRYRLNAFCDVPYRRRPSCKQSWNRPVSSSEIVRIAAQC